MSSAATLTTWPEEKGFGEQIVRAQYLEARGRIPQAHCVYAGAHYSRTSVLGVKSPVRAAVHFRRAKLHAGGAAHHMTQYREDGFTPQSFDIVGKILLVSWLVWKAEPNLALQLLLSGLKKKNLPPHCEALLRIGIAEGHFLLGDNPDTCKEYIQYALHCEESVKAENDHKKAWKCFSSVLGRAAILYQRLGDTATANLVIDMALAYARDPRFGSKSQLQKLNREWHVANLPGFVQALLPPQ